MVTAVVYICARSSLKTATTTTPSAMNPFRKRHTDDKMCQIALVVVVAVAAAHFGVFNLFVCVFVCLFFSSFAHSPLILLVYRLSPKKKI